MNKVDLSKIDECTLVKLRKHGLCVLLTRKYGKVFYSKNIISEGDLTRTSGITILGHKSLFEDGQYDVIAYKNYPDQITVLKSVLLNKEPSDWDWVENEKLDELTKLIDKLKQQLSEAETELSKIK